MRWYMVRIVREIRLKDGGILKSMLTLKVLSNDEHDASHKAHCGLDKSWSVVNVYCAQ